MSVSPEIIAEQVMGYVVGASELIPTLKPSPKAPYSIAILPQGPHFYTGLLQAAGYLLLDNQKKKVLIISQQTDDPKSVLIDTKVYGPIFGQSRKNSMTEITTLARKLGAKLATSGQTSLSESVTFQLPFLRVITETEEIIHISIGINISSLHMKKLLSWITNHMQIYNIIFLTNIDLPHITKSKKSDEEKYIAKLIQTASAAAPLLTIFQNVLNAQKKKPEIIAYVNPGDFGKTASLTTRYVCAVG